MRALELLAESATNKSFTDGMLNGKLIGKTVEGVTFDKIIDSDRQNKYPNSVTYAFSFVLATGIGVRGQMDYNFDHMKDPQDFILNRLHIVHLPNGRWDRVDGGVNHTVEHGKRDKPFAVVDKSTSNPAGELTKFITKVVDLVMNHISSTAVTESLNESAANDTLISGIVTGRLVGKTVNGVEFTEAPPSHESYLGAFNYRWKCEVEKDIIAHGVIQIHYHPRNKSDSFIITRWSADNIHFNFRNKFRSADGSVTRMVDPDQPTMESLETFTRKLRSFLVTSAKYIS